MPRAARLLALALAVAAASAGARAAELKVEWAPLAVSVDSYQVERRIDEPGEDFVPLVRLSGDSTHFVDRNVVAGLRYCYRVRGVRGERTSPPSPPLCSVAQEAAPAASPEPVADAVPAASPEPVADAVPAASPEPVADAVPAANPEPLADAAPAPESPVAPEPPPVEAAAAAAPAIVDRDVKALHRPQPRYPAEAIAKRIEGWVKVRFTVTAAGTTRDIEVVAADPPGVFETVAVEAASGFRYRPKTVAGSPVDRAGVETEITFSLIDRGGDVINFPR